jgi:hypothetical protein
MLLVHLEQMVGRKEMRIDQDLMVDRRVMALDLDLKVGQRHLCLASKAFQMLPGLLKQMVDQKGTQTGLDSMVVQTGRGSGSMAVQMQNRVLVHRTLGQTAVQRLGLKVVQMLERVVARRLEQMVAQRLGRKVAQRLGRKVAQRLEQKVVQRQDRALVGRRRERRAFQRLQSGLAMYYQGHSQEALRRDSSLM